MDERPQDADRSWAWCGSGDVRSRHGVGYEDVLKLARSEEDDARGGEWRRCCGRR
jgi:hypothetical protein